MSSAAAGIDLARELDAASRAVRAAAAVCRRVQAEMVGRDGPVAPARIDKSDRSPVTVADFASQALVRAVLAGQSGVDGMVAEESAAELADAAELRAQVVAQVSAARGTPVGEADVLAWIDGGRVADAAASSLHWTLDPLDGTKGFLRGEHYAVALALIADGQVLLGALGCPRLAAPDGSQGLLLTAARGRGTWAQPLFAGQDVAAIRIRATEAPGDQLRLCESVEAGHSDHAAAAAIAARLGITSAPLRLDSQAKYAAVAQGDAAVYLRMPTRADYREKVWDHAAGLIAVEEAGGQVSDVQGAPLDFSHGRTLAANRGVIATHRHLHATVLAAVAEVLGRGSA